MTEAPERYCSHCGGELSLDDPFCPNCGKPVHRTAHVPTPEAYVPVPPAPQQAGGTGAAAPQQAPLNSVRIALAVLLAGILPLMIVYVVLVAAVSIIGIAPTDTSYPPFRPPYLLLYFLVHVLIPLALGFRAGAAWPGKHTKGIGVLALLAGVTEAVAVKLIVPFHSFFFWWSYNLYLEDFIAPIVTATLFMGGGLFADLVEQWRSLRSERETMRAQGEPIEAPAHSEERNKTMLLLIQSLGPAALTLIGTITAAIITATR
jgi:zinc-ribbon domain